MIKYLVETDNTQSSYLAKTVCCTEYYFKDFLLEMLYRIYTLLQFCIPLNN